MARKASFQGSAKTVTVTAVQTIVFTPTDIESAGCVQLMFAWTGAGNTNADIDRVRVRAGGDIIVDVPFADLQAYQQRFSKNNTANAGAGTAFSIPLNFLDAPTQEAQDKCQFPPNREIQVEVVTLNTTVAGTLFCGWKQTDVPAEFYMRYYSSQLNIGTSVRNGKFPFAEGGIIRGFTLPVAGIDRAELVVSDRSAWRLSGAQFGGVASGDLFTEKDFFDDGSTVTTRRCSSVDLGLPAAAGSSYLVMDTGAAWSGVTESGSIYAAVPLAQRG
jgi:hypothetical protein